MRNSVLPTIVGLTVALIPQWLLAAPAPGFEKPDHAIAPSLDQAANPGAHETGIQWISPIFGNDGKMGLLWILINFAVLMYLLEKLLFSKLRARTAAKSDAIKSELERATEARKAAESVMTDARGRLDKLDAEVKSILDEAKERAQADRARIVAAAEAEAERIKDAARASAEREAEARRRELEAEIVDAAIARAEVILRGRIGAADQARMVDDFVGQIATAPMPGFQQSKPQDGRAST